MLVNLSDADLLARMRNFEDHLVERKTVKDEKDWKKTAVAFANSAPIGVPAVLYIGVRNNGDIETPQQNLDETQRRFNSKMQQVYPRIAYVPKIIADDGRQALAVIIPGSELRPHFAGLSYIRIGSETREASEQQFAELIAQRNSKVRKILSYKGRPVLVFNRYGSAFNLTESMWTGNITVTDCNEFWLTLMHDSALVTIKMKAVEISFDHAKDKLRIDINQNI
jgi:predicted HTH transcriptional regulator